MTERGSTEPSCVENATEDLRSSLLTRALTSAIRSAGPSARSAGRTCVAAVPPAPAQVETTMRYLHYVPQHDGCPAHGRVRARKHVSEDQRTGTIRSLEPLANARLVRLPR